MTILRTGVMKKIGWVIGLLALSLSAYFILFNSESSYLKVLVFSKTTEYRHSSIEVGQQMIKDLGEQHHFEVMVTEDASVFNEEILSDINVIIFLNTTGDVLDDNQQLELNRYIQAGGGFVGIHSATDTEYQWPYYNQLVGAYFDGHPEITQAAIQIVDNTHEFTMGLPPVWTLTEELYNFRDIVPEINVLLNLDETSYQGGTNGEYHPLSWYRSFDGGRMWYTELGHREELYLDPLFIEHVWGGIKYAAGPKTKINYDNVSVGIDQNRFTKEVLDQNLYEPMELELLPNDNVLFIQRHGEVMLYDKNLKKTSLMHKFDVFSDLEDGLLGVTLDPDFEENKLIYFFRSHPTDTLQVISKFKMADDYSAFDVKSESQIITIPTQRLQCCHAAGSIEFGPDKMLYIALGDNTNPHESDGYAPIDDRPGRFPWDARKSSANTNDLRGKILRIKVEEEGYSIPEGNLFPKDGSGGRPEIYVMGCRNPYRISFDNRRGFLYWGDVGPDANKDSLNRGSMGYDEINQTRMAGNFGWPLFIANNQPYYDYDWETQKSGLIFDPKEPVNDSRYNTGARILPPAQSAFFWYSYGNSSEFPLLGNGGRTAMAGPTFYIDDYPESDNRFPQYYDGKLFIYEWMRGWMMAVTVDEEGNYVRMERFLPDITLSNPTDMIMSRSGDIYLLEYGSGWFQQNPDVRLVHLKYNGGNQKPVAKINSSDIYGKEPLLTWFSANESFDAEGGELAYEWTLDGKIISDEKSFQYTFDRSGEFNIQLQVMDEESEIDATTVMIMVGNSSPVVKWEIKGNKTFYWDNAKIDYQVVVTDEEDGAIGSGISPSEITATINYLPEGLDRNNISLGHQQLSNFGEGKMLLEGSDCTSCHHEKNPSVGPSLEKVAAKYAYDGGAKKYLISKIQNGGSGIWGQIAMAAHPALSNDDAGLIVDYILSLSSDHRENNLPLQGQYAFEAHTATGTMGAYVLSASYTDNGGGLIGALRQEEILILRNPIIAADAFDVGIKASSMHIKAGQVAEVEEDLNFYIAENGTQVGYKAIDFTDIQKIKLTILQFPKYFNGGSIEFRLDSAEGQVIGVVDIDQGLLDLGEKVLEVILPKIEGLHDFYIVSSSESGAVCGVTFLEFLR